MEEINIFVVLIYLIVGIIVVYLTEEDNLSDGVVETIFWPLILLIFIAGKILR